jgi:hypothetical protein
MKSNFDIKIKDIDQNNLHELNVFINKFLSHQCCYFGENIDATRKIQHIISCCKIFEMINKNPNLIETNLIKLAVKTHDIGRFEQLRLINSYDDKIISHNELGAAILEGAIKRKEIKDSLESRIIQKIVKFHGQIEYLKKSTLSTIPKKIQNWTKIVSIVDDLDNACITAPMRLEYEILNDAKHLYKNKINQKKITLKNFLTYIFNKKIDRKQCKTYADYILFNISIINKFLRNKFFGKYVRHLLSDANYSKYLKHIDKFITGIEAVIIKKKLKIIFVTQNRNHNKICHH